jgi:beta-1,2-mannobiose phosphorylase / 1,2-beta-oligomannan phosphorylase
MSGFKLQRLGLMMEPEPGNPQEIEGILNLAGLGLTLERRSASC